MILKNLKPSFLTSITSLAELAGLFVLASFLASLIGASPLSAQDAAPTTRGIIMLATFEPQSAQIGVTSSQTGLEQFETTFIRRAQGDYFIEIPAAVEKLLKTDQSLLLFASLIDPQGQTSLSTLREVTDLEPIVPLAICPSQAATIKPANLNAMYSNLGVLESLLEVRRKRRSISQEQIKSLLDGQFLEKLQKLEEGLGFKYPLPLSAQLNSFELLERLSQIEMALASYIKNNRN